MYITRIGIYNIEPYHDGHSYTVRVIKTVQTIKRNVRYV